ncbi:hypothetical protein MNEG_5520, partial [Monoraphidium neglectum]
MQRGASGGAPGKSWRSRASGGEGNEIAITAGGTVCGRTLWVAFVAAGWAK